MLVTLNSIAIIKTDFEDADFYLQRRGSIETVGTPSRSKDADFAFNKESIGIKITNDDFDAGYMYWVMVMAHNKGFFKPLANGTTSLMSIKISDVKKITF